MVIQLEVNNADKRPPFDTMAAPKRARLAMRDGGGCLRALHIVLRSGSCVEAQTLATRRAAVSNSGKWDNCR
jgi:hypothetical protein